MRNTIPKGRGTVQSNLVEIAHRICKRLEANKTNIFLVFSKRTVIAAFVRTEPSVNACYLLRILDNQEPERKIALSQKERED